jgi:hypothetical protein
MFRTSLHRGYIGYWELIDLKLYLTNIEGMIDTENPLRSEDIFNGTPVPIFAEWYTGSLILTRGNYIRIEGSFNRIYELIEEILVKRGNLVKREMKKYNKKTGKYSKI